ncbi:MAG: prephenate dehydrogenase [Anaerolineae bacterium]|nr:prephenate dehydrogenase [Anaerolineae bacterium]
MTVQLTVIGCNRLGTSVGLALAGETAQLKRVAHDPNPTLARAAEKMGAFDKVTLNLHNAVADADIVLLALPLAQAWETLETIAPTLKEGCLVLDTAPARVASLAAAARVLPAGRHFVTFTPTLSPDTLMSPDLDQKAASAELFKNSQVFLSGAPGTEGEAIKLAYDLAVLLGARPFFADPYETDGLWAGTHLLPQLTAAALVDTATTQPGWSDARRVAGAEFAIASAPLLFMEAEQPADVPWEQRENLTRLLDDYIASLHDLRKALSAGDPQALGEWLANAAAARETWLAQRHTSDWDPKFSQTEIPSSGEMLGRLVGIRPKKKKA